MKNKKGLIIFVIAAVLVLAGGYFGWRQFDSAYVIMDGRIIARDSQELDLSGEIPIHPDRLNVFTELKEVDMSGGGLTPEDYDSLHQSFPDCDIQWDVPFQGGFYNSHSPQHLSARNLSDEDVRNLGYFQQLISFDAEGCRDYPQIMELMRIQPDCQVTYSVTVGSSQISNSETSLTVADALPDDVKQALQYLPGIKTVTFQQEGLDFKTLSELIKAYPQVNFTFPVELYGVHFRSTDTELDFSGIPMDTTGDIDAVAGLMPNLQKVIMAECGLSNEDMDGLCQKYPHIKFVWNVNIGPFMTVSTDAVYFMPTKLGYTVSNADLENLKYCTDIICLDLGHMPISDCSFLEYLPHVRYLVLADTKISDISPLENLKELVFLELFLTQVKDYSPLLGCTALEDLNISYTQGDPAVIGQITWLKRLWWTGSGMTNEQLDALIASLPDAQIERPSISSTGRGWRHGEHYYAMRDILGMPYSE